MARFNLPSVPTETFTVDKESKKLICEMSTVSCFVKGFHRIYDDAYDEGLATKNAKSGLKVAWSVVGELTNSDNDIMFWELKPIHECIQADSRLANWKMVIYNT